MSKTQNFYVVHDIVANTCLYAGVDFTDNRFAFVAMQMFGKQYKLSELQIFKVATYDGVNVNPIAREFIPWSVASVKETQAENISLVSGDSTSEFVAKMKDEMN